MQSACDEGQVVRPRTEPGPNTYTATVTYISTHPDTMTMNLLSLRIRSAARIYPYLMPSARLVSSSSPPDRFNRPAPHPLPPAQQREFEELVRRAYEGPPDSDTSQPPQTEFQGDINPETGEQGGPKREPVRRWTQDEGDWSFKGRVSDF